MKKRTLSHKELGIFKRLGLISIYEQCWQIDTTTFLARDRRTSVQRTFEYSGEIK